MTEFEKELEALINRHCLENGSNTPDFLLAAYLRRSLETWNACVLAREQWFGRAEKSGGPDAAVDVP